MLQNFLAMLKGSKLGRDLKQFTNRKTFRAFDEELDFEVTLCWRPCKRFWEHKIYYQFRDLRRKKIEKTLFSISKEPSLQATDLDKTYQTNQF